MAPLPVVFLTTMRPHRGFFMPFCPWGQGHFGTCRYEAAGGDINELRRGLYAKNRDRINAQKRAAYTLRQKNRGKKVAITEIAVEKVPRVVFGGLSLPAREQPVTAWALPGERSGRPPWEQRSPPAAR